MIGSPQLRLTWGIWPEMSIWQNWDTQLCCGVCRTLEACNLVARNACNEDRRRFSWEILSGKRLTNGQSNRWHIWRHIWRYNLTSCHAIQHDTSRLETMARNVWSSINRAPTSVTTSATSPVMGPGWGAWFRITCWQCQNISPFWLLSHVDLKSNYDDRSMSSTASAARGSS